MAKRVGVASIIQETNTFSANQSTLQDFELQGIWLGADVVTKSQGMNIEVAGSLERLRTHGFEAVPLMRAWAMSGGVLLDTELAKMKAILKREITAADHLDGLILNLHGALINESDDHTDAHITEFAREILGADVPIVVTHDLHGNPSRRIVAASDALIGFRTYPHIDQGDTGRRAADLMKELLSNNRRLGTVLKKLNMIIPAETMGTSDQPLLQIRELADSLIDDEILDISLFPVQPWIDVAEVGFGITVVHSGNHGRANECAEIIRRALWKIHQEFQATLYSVEDAIGHAIKGYQGKMQVIAQSSDAPTGGSTGDDSRVVAALVNYGIDIPSACTVVDGPAVDNAFAQTIGDDVSLSLGFMIDPRWGTPVAVHAKLINKGDAPVVLTGPAMTGQVVSIGRWVVLQSANKVQILVSESATTTFDPAGYEVAGIDLDECVIVHVRSPLLFKSGFAGRYGQAFSLDLDGPTTPNIKKLTFNKVPRPMIGLDEFDGELAEVSSD
jgi:microcystin degradation protein MlrC